jgi:hypothetical protein
MQDSEHGIASTCIIAQTGGWHAAKTEQGWVCNSCHNTGLSYVLLLTQHKVGLPSTHQGVPQTQLNGCLQEDSSNKTHAGGQAGRQGADMLDTGA